MKLKSFTLSILFLFLTVFVNAQCEIANGSFEDWSIQDLILTDANGDEVVGEVLLPEGTTPFLRFLFIAFSAAFDPSYAALLENEAQELAGISPSQDASDGEFAVKLQTGYGIEISDIYGISGCNEVPEQFNLDVKHIGQTNDTLTVFVLFSNGIAPLPETEEDLEDVPAYATTQLVYNSDTEYETLNLPVIQNFEADVDTFYYLIIAETFDDSYFLIDNVNFGDGSSDCTVTAAEISFPEGAGSICSCNNSQTLIDLEYEKGNFMYQQAIVDEFGNIEDLDNLGEGDFNSYCPEGGNKSVVVISYDFTQNGPSTNDNINDLPECMEVSNALELEFTSIPILELLVFMDGEEQDGQFSICTMDDIQENITFDVVGEADNIAILVLDDNNEIVRAVFSSTTIQTGLEWLEPGEYIIGLINYDQTFIIEEGQNVQDYTFEGCFSASDNFFTLSVLGEDDGCVTNTEQVYNGKLSIRPNYSAGYFEISNPENESFMYTVTDMTGKMVINQNNISNNSSIDLTEYANGVYIISFDIEGSVHREKIVKM